jgi:hypothetical protein
MSLSIDDFKGALTGGGARPNLFRVTGFGVGGLEFLCKGANLPAAIVGQIDVPFRGRQLKIAGDRTFENWTITVINDTDFAIRDNFVSWQNTINDHVAGTGNASPSSYMRSGIVTQLDRSGGALKTYQIKDAFPVNVGAIELSYDSTDAIEEFTVELAFSYWTPAG